jgi:hypothetical protein
VGHGDDLHPLLFRGTGEGNGEIPVSGYETDFVHTSIKLQTNLFVIPAKAGIQWIL